MPAWQSRWCRELQDKNKNIMYKQVSTPSSRANDPGLYKEMGKKCCQIKGPAKNDTLHSRLRLPKTEVPS